ncbi:MAG: hypothetical protein O7B25_05660 [Gammaproteobacteria bacterium]|nr:hypothetical protein [Gammaproteobacteria bacterium]
MADLVQKIVEVHRHLALAELPHAFGGALALAWCTERARGTIDIDINVFVDVDACEGVFAALPAGVKVTRGDQKILRKEGQVRVWWEKTPLDLFLNTTPYHREVANRIRWEQFGGEMIPFIACLDIAVFKAFFNRSRDWVDIEEMQAAGTLDAGRVIRIMDEYLGSDDERIASLRRISA